MTFVVQGEILMDGSDAKSEVTKLRAEQDKLKTSAGKVSQTSSQLGRTLQGTFSPQVSSAVARLNKNLSQTTALANAQSQVWTKQAAEQRKAIDGLKSSTGSFKAYGQEIGSVTGKLALARHRAATWLSSLRNLDQTQALAAGSAANLTAQFNDIGVMMAAGQDPMQLAIQQGTQITQVFGNRGAAAALGATRQAVLNMISPLNLITIGSIAAGAALVNWLSSAGREAESFEDRLKAMSDAVQAFGDRQKEAFQSSADMIEQFGSASPELRLLLRDLAAFAEINAKRDLDDTAKSIADLATKVRGFRYRSDRSVGHVFLGLDAFTAEAREFGAALNENLDILQRSTEPAEQLKAAYDVRDVFMEATSGLESLSVSQEDFFVGLAQLIQQLEVFGARIRQPWDDLRETGSDLWSSLTANAQDYLGNRLEIDAAARSTIQQLRLEAEINEAIRVSGEGSVEVAELRLQAERELQQERVNELEITETLKAEMMASWDAANGVASVDMAGNISLAADQAQRLKEQLHAARGARIMARVRENPDFSDPRGESPGAGNPDYIYREQGLPPVRMPPNPRKSRSGGGAAATNRERKAIEELLRREAERLEVLRETDPVQQEMIRHREAMKSATDAEREALEKIVRERVEEQQAIEATQQAGAFLGDTMGDVLTALQAQGDDAAAAWDRVKASIAAAILEAALLGDGPLAGVFGTADGGGLLGSVFGVQKKADGGIITGQGGDRSDKEIALVSPGEFFVNAKATRKHRHLLEAINAGALLPGMAPAFANGGAFAAPPLPSAPGGSLGAGTGEGVSRVLIQPSALFKAVVEQQSRDTAIEVTETYDREHSRSSFDRNVNDPWSVG